jgi:hypothetical protein
MGDMTMAKRKDGQKAFKLLSAEYDERIADKVAMQDVGLVIAVILAVLLSAWLVVHFGV